MSLRGLFRYFWLWLRWQFGIKGKPCKCSFYEASHFNNALEWDVDSYPCGRFTPRKDTTHDQ